MEKMNNPQEWRNEKAKDLKGVLNHEERVKKLEELKETGEYKYTKIIKVLRNLGVLLEDHEVIQHGLDSPVEPRRDANLNRLRRHLGLEDYQHGYYRNREINPGFIARNLVLVEDLVPGTDTKNILSLDSGDISNFESIVSLSDSYLRIVEKELFKMINEGSSKVDLLRENFSDKVIVDVGAGPKPYGYKIACILGAKGYIAVEPNFYKELVFSFLQFKDGENFIQVYDEKTVDNFQKKGFGIKPIPFNIVSEPGQIFLKRLPDNSVVPIACGLKDLMETNEYNKDKIPKGFENGAIIRKELGRVISHDSYYLKVNALTPILTEGKKMKKFVSGNSDSDPVESFSVDYIL